MGRIVFGRRLLASFAAFVCLTLVATALAGPAAAVPAFAVQTGQNCNACHVGGFGPQLTPFGRQFKLMGFTLRTHDSSPLSAMIVASYIRTEQAQSPPPHYAANDNVTLDQISLFMAGGINQHLGGFVQATYDGVARTLHWDNMDLRAVNTASLAGHNVIYGVSLNNSPTISDPFNSLGAWGFPYTTSSLAPAPGAAPIIGAFAQTTVGATAYAWYDSKLYAEAGAYVSPSGRFLTRMGVDPTSPGSLRNAAPYARLAWDQDVPGGNVQVGAFGLWTDVQPGGDTSTGTSDRYADTGLDMSYQRFWDNKDAFTLNARFTHEAQTLNASQQLGLAQNLHSRLNDLRVDASYYWRNRIGGTVAAFNTTGTADPLIYAGNRTFKPDSNGVMVQVDGTPWGGGGSPLGPRFNMRMGAQYFHYNQFDGAARNYDGLGHNASDNDTVRLFAWFAY